MELPPPTHPWGFNAPPAFRGPGLRPPGHRIRWRHPGGPMDGWGGVAASRPHLTRHGDQHVPHRTSRIWGQAPSRWLPLRKGKRSRTTTGYPNNSTAGPRPRNTSERLRGWQRQGTDEGVILPRRPSRCTLRCTDPASEYVRAAQCDPGRQSGQARSSGYLWTSPPAGPFPPLPGVYPGVTPRAVCQAVGGDYPLAGRRFHPATEGHPYVGDTPTQGGPASASPPGITG